VARAAYVRARQIVSPTATAAPSRASTIVSTTAQRIADAAAVRGAVGRTGSGSTASAATSAGSSAAAGASDAGRAGVCWGDDPSAGGAGRAGLALLRRRRSVGSKGRGASAVGTPSETVWRVGR
jgi:hypothetical protein